MGEKSHKLPEPDRPWMMRTYAGHSDAKRSNELRKNLAKGQTGLSGILAGMQEGVLLLDRQGRVALVNPALREMLLLGADAVGKTPLEVMRHAELKELFDERRALGAGRHRRDRGRAGSSRAGCWCASRRSPGEERGLFAVFVDVTEMRRLESLRRDFVANVSHELRTPVTAIRSAAETLDGVATAIPRRRGNSSTSSSATPQRLQRLVEDLLDLSRIESRELRLELGALELRAVCEHVSSLFRERADKKRIRLEIDVPDDVPPVARRPPRARADAHQPGRQRGQVLPERRA